MTLPIVQATRGSFGNAMFLKRVATACGAYCLRRVLRLTALRGRRERPYCRIVLRPMRLNSYPLGEHSVWKMWAVWEGWAVLEWWEWWEWWAMWERFVRQRFARF